MPRRLLLGCFGVVALAATAVCSAVPTASADPGPRPNPVLDRADAVFDGRADPVVPARRVDGATRPLRRPAEARLCSSRWWPARLLARPTDGGQDPGGDGYQGRSRKRCGKRICVHYAVRGADAPPSHGGYDGRCGCWGSVWDHEVDGCGSGRRRRPASRRQQQFDVYLADARRRGLFGYCTPEHNKPGSGSPPATACSTTTSPGGSSAPTRRQPAGHRGARVLPRGPVRLRLPRGPVAAGVHSHLDRGEVRRPGRRQPAVPAAARSAGPVSRSTLRQRPVRPVRQLGLVGVPHRAVRQRLVRAVWRQSRHSPEAPPTGTPWPRCTRSWPGTAGWPRRSRRTPPQRQLAAHFLEEGAS